MDRYYAELIVSIWNTYIIALWGVPLLLMIFIATRRKWRWQERGAVLLLLASAYVFLLVIPGIKESEEKKMAKAVREAQEAKAAAFAKEARAYFHKKCAEDSGRFIYKTVTEPQESVYMMKPRKKPTTKELADQFWMGDPYGGATIAFEMPELSGLLQTKAKKTPESDEFPLFSFVETHDLDQPDQLWRYYPTPIKDGGCPRGRQWYRCEPAKSIQSRYGFTWDDLSTREDRHYWVAKSRLQIVDLQTKEVVAERIGYVIESGFGHIEYGGATLPWQDTKGGGSFDGHNWNVNFCPPRRHSSDTRWIWSVLNNLPFNEK